MILICSIKIQISHRCRSSMVHASIFGRKILPGVSSSLIESYRANDFQNQLGQPSNANRLLCRALTAANDDVQAVSTRVHWAIFGFRTLVDRLFGAETCYVGKPNRFSSIGEEESLSSIATIMSGNTLSQSISWFTWFYSSFGCNNWHSVRCELIAHRQERNDEMTWGNCALHTHYSATAVPCGLRPS